MSDIEIRNKLNAPHLGKQSALHPLIAARAQLRHAPDEEHLDAASYWTAQWWGLADCGIFQSMSPDRQRAALSGCNRSIMNEAYFIEKSGLAYTAKMVLTAESTDVAQLYALIGADEARHLAWIAPYLDEQEKVSPSGEFLAFLSELIENVKPHLLIYLVQIILEGWGLDHYKRLADGCQQPDLAQVWSSILKDEALHHRSGTLLFNARSLSPDEVALIEQSLISYAEMVRVGPLAALGAVNTAAGGLSQSQLEEVLQSLRHTAESQRKLTLLQNLMRQPGLESVVDKLAEQNYFAPLPVPDAVAAYLS